MSESQEIAVRQWMVQRGLIKQEATDDEFESARQWLKRSAPWIADRWKNPRKGVYLATTSELDQALEAINTKRSDTYHQKQQQAYELNARNKACNEKNKALKAANQPLMLTPEERAHYLETPEGKAAYTKAYNEAKAKRDQEPPPPPPGELPGGPKRRPGRPKGPKQS